MRGARMYELEQHALMVGDAAKGRTPDDGDEVAATDQVAATSLGGMAVEQLFRVLNAISPGLCSVGNLRGWCRRAGRDRAQLRF